MAGNPAGNAITNEIMYIANMFGKRQIPYGGAAYNALQGVSNFLNRTGIGTGSAPSTRAQNTGMYGRYIPGTLQKPIGGTPQERAQAAETSRVAQLTAQDPELQRYETARLKAVAPSAAPEAVQAAEDIGMQIWRQKYGTTPMGQTGGAVGSFNPLMQKTFGYQSGMAPDQLIEMQKTAAPIPVAPGAMPYQLGDLGTRASLETGYDPAAYGLTPDKIEEMKKKLLQQASK
jgi:hypothetical protein